MTTAALVLVDCQRDYLAAPGLEPAADRIVAAAADLLALARARGVPVLHVRTTVRRDDDRRMPHWKRAGRWICVEGTPGHEPPPPLAPAEGEAVFDKPFYSAFGAPGFDAALRAAGARTVVVAGLHLHACVRATALDAYAAGFDVVIAADAVGSDDPLHAAATARWLGRRAGRFLSPEAIAALLDGRAVPVPEASPALAAAAEAFPAWASTPVAERGALLGRVAALLEGERDWLTRELAGRIGKPVRYGAGEVDRAAALLRMAARQAADAAWERACGDGVLARRRPHGVVALVTPWNNPIAIPAGKLGPALAFGNTVAWKPAPVAEWFAHRVGELLRRAGAPDGVLGVVTGDAGAARTLMDDARVAAITLTGSAAAGFVAQEIAARRHVPLQAELGGNNAAIVWRDTDAAAAAAAIADGAFAQAGQRCTANRRVIVEAGFAGEFVGLLRDATAALVVGDPRDPATQVGPLVSPAARARVEAALARAREAGHAVHSAHAAPEGDFVAPAIVSCDDPDDPIVTEELFGPVLVVQRADDFGHALALLDGVRQGLVAALFSASPARRTSFLSRARAGILKLDRSTADAGPEAPFGGWKASGVGPPEHGDANLEFYTRAQAVYGV